MCPRKQTTRQEWLNNRHWVNILISLQLNVLIFYYQFIYIFSVKLISLVCGYVKNCFTYTAQKTKQMFGVTNFLHSCKANACFKWTHFTRILKVVFPWLHIWQVEIVSQILFRASNLSDKFELIWAFWLLTKIRVHVAAWF